MENTNYNNPQFQQDFNQGDFNQFQQSPNNNMALSIIGTILGLCSPCCIGLILGIVAIIMSSQVNTKFISGDSQGAISSANTAKILAIIAIALGVLGLIGQVISLALGGAGYYQELLQQIKTNNI